MKIPDVPVKSGAQAESGLKPDSLKLPVLKADIQGQPPKIQFTAEPHGPSAGKAIAAGELFMEAAGQMGFPKDTLSVAILAFARLFSMSVSPEAMKNLRREILSSGKPSSPEDPRDKAVLEAETLARLSARDKGVVLSTDALKHYSSYFGHPGGGGKDQDGNNQEKPDRKENPGAEELLEITESESENDDLLGFLNSLPGKKGSYWQVFPFTVKVRGIQMRVFIRLLKGELLSPPEKGRLIVDISGPKRQWRCFLKEKEGKFNADILTFPEYENKALKNLCSEAEHFLKQSGGLFGKFNGFGKVTIRNSDEAFSWLEDLRNESLPSINKEV